MAWIETEDHNVVNLDNVDYLGVKSESYCIRLIAYQYSENHYIAHLDYTIIDPVLPIVQRVERLMVQIAQIARGNAYISQDDIMRMMDEQE